jgi:hypothetical protein
MLPAVVNLYSVKQRHKLIEQVQKCACVSETVTAHWINWWATKRMTGVRFPTRYLAVFFYPTKIDSGIHPHFHTMRAEFSSPQIQISGTRSGLFISMYINRHQAIRPWTLFALTRWCQMTELFEIYVIYLLYNSPVELVAYIWQAYCRMYVCSHTWGMDCWMDLLIIYTHDAELQALITLSLIYTLYKSLDHELNLLSLLPLVVSWEQLLIVKILQLHALKSSLHRLP